MNDYPEKFWAGGFLYSPQRNAVFLHKRDANTKFNPNKWAFFGGLNEGAETPIECFVRELKEEIDLDANKNEVVELCAYMNVELSTYRVVFYVVSDISESELTLGEGAGFGWVKLICINDYDLTEKTKEDLDVFISALK